MARRWERWWSFDADRPLLLASAHKRSDIRWGKVFDLLDRPAEWLEARRLQVESTHYVGEAIPSIRADIGPVTIAAFAGAPLHLAENEQTSWQEPIIADWDDSLNLSRLDTGNGWFKRVMELLALVASDGASRYVACLPDLTGAIDALSNLRGPQRLCLDLFENRDRVIRHSLELVDAWEQAFARMHELVLEKGTGIVHSLGCWSMVPHTLPSCDFNALIGTRDFEEVCLPSLREQALRAGRCILHVDGPQAVRHAEVISSGGRNHGGAVHPWERTPSAAAKLPMFRLLQQHRKPVYVSCPSGEVERIAGEL